MSESIVETPLEQVRRRLDTEILTQHVRRLLGRKRAELISWNCEAVHGGAGEYVGALGVFRVYGVAQDGTDHLPWSLILKIVNDPSRAGGVSPAGNWKREALAYQSGLLTSLPAGLRVPICYGVTEIPAHADQAEEAWIWPEEIPQVDKPPWTFDRIQHVARALGRFNGAYLGHELLSTYPWLGQGRTQEWLALSEPVLRDLDRYRQNPFVALWISDENMIRLQILWQAREQLMKKLQHLPRTLCHHDAFVRNILLASTATGEQVVAIDWGYIGLGALGAEIATLMHGSYNFMDLDVAHIKEAEEQVWAGYMMGLHDAGWQGEAQEVRFAYAATSALASAIGWVGVWMPLVVKRMEVIETLLGHSAAEIAAAWTQLLHFRLNLGEEALRLAGSAS